MGFLDDYALNVRDVLPEQAPQVLGRFEPVMAVLFMNVDDDAFERWRQSPSSDPTFSEVFWHETYHCIQCYTTGYAYARCLRFAEVVRATLRSSSLVLGREFARRCGSIVFDKLAELASMPLSAKAREMLAHARRLHANANHIDWVSSRQLRPGRWSIWGAMFPDLHATLQAVDRDYRFRGEDGLSAEDLLEGSAWLFGRDVVLEQMQEPRPTQAQAPQGKGLAEDVYEPGYARLRDVSRKSAPSCSNRQIRAAAALALRYERPGGAYRPLFDRVVRAGEGDEVAVARELAARLPVIERAGAILGSARDQHAAQAGKYNVYDAQLDRLRTEVWKLDELDLLISTGALNAVPAGELGFTLATRGGARGGSNASVLIASMLLPTGRSIEKLRRDFRAQLPK